MASGSDAVEKKKQDAEMAEVKKEEEEQQAGARDDVCYFCGLIHEKSASRSGLLTGVCVASLYKDVPRFRLNVFWGGCCFESSMASKAVRGGYCARVIHLAHFSSCSDWHSSNFCASGRCPVCAEDRLINVGCDCRCVNCISKPLVVQHCAKV